jgi:hypothetical protein
MNCPKCPGNGFVGVMSSNDGTHLVVFCHYCGTEGSPEDFGANRAEVQRLEDDLRAASASVRYDAAHDL